MYAKTSLTEKCTAKRSVADFFITEKDNSACSIGKGVNERKRILLKKSLGDNLFRNGVCNRKVVQKRVCYRKAFDIKKLNDQTCVKAKTVNDRKERL